MGRLIRLREWRPPLEAGGHASDDPPPTAWDSLVRPT
jgi:hypothetical protein